MNKEQNQKEKDFCFKCKKSFKDAIKLACNHNYCQHCLCKALLKKHLIFFGHLKYSNYFYLKI